MARVVITLTDTDKLDPKGNPVVEIKCTPSMKEIFGLDENGTGLTMAQCMAAFMCRSVREKVAEQDRFATKANKMDIIIPRIGR